MTETLDLSAGRIAHPGDPGFDTAATLAATFTISVLSLNAGGPEVGAALGAVIATLWLEATDEEFTQVLDSVRRAALGNRALRGRNAGRMS